MDINMENKEEEEEHIVLSSEDDDAEDDNYQISPRTTRGPALDDDNDDMEKDDDVEDELRRQVEEEEPEERRIHSQRNVKIPFCPRPTLRRAHKPYSYNVINYKGKGTTKEVKRLRKIDPRSHHKEAPDYMLRTHFQQDFYETIILTRKKQVSEAQWVDWRHMVEQDNPIFNQVVAPCTNLHIKEIMGFKFDSNKEVIAQLFATLYVEEIRDARICIGYPRVIGMASLMMTLPTNLDSEGKTKGVQKFTLVNLLMSKK
jgi:hypothetical protein